MTMRFRQAQSRLFFWLIAICLAVFVEVILLAQSETNLHAAFIALDAPQLEQAQEQVSRHVHIIGSTCKSLYRLVMEVR